MKKKLKEETLTQQEWYDSMKIPPPHTPKKKYSRKGKNKKIWRYEE